MKKTNNGLYETANVTWVSDSKGNYHRSFDDVFIYADEENFTVEREMTINKSKVRVHSVFPTKAVSTATEKLLSIIDSDMEKLATQSC